MKSPFMANRAIEPPLPSDAPEPPPLSLLHDSANAIKGKNNILFIIHLTSKIIFYSNPTYNYVTCRTIFASVKEYVIGRKRLGKNVSDTFGNLLAFQVKTH
jgi:hypothetical protein